MVRARHLTCQLSSRKVRRKKKSSQKVHRSLRKQNQLFHRRPKAVCGIGVGWGHGVSRVGSSRVGDFMLIQSQVWVIRTLKEHVSYLSTPAFPWASPSGLISVIGRYLPHCLCGVISSCLVHPAAYSVFIIMYHHSVFNTPPVTVS